MVAILLASSSAIAGTLQGQGQIIVTSVANPVLSAQELQIKTNISVSLKPGEEKELIVDVHNPNTGQFNLKQGSFRVLNQGGFRGRIYAPDLDAGGVAFSGQATRGIRIRVKADADAQASTHTFTYSMQSDVQSDFDLPPLPPN